MGFTWKRLFLGSEFIVTLVDKLPNPLVVDFPISGLHFSLCGDAPFGRADFLECESSNFFHMRWSCLNPSREYVLKMAFLIFLPLSQVDLENATVVCLFSISPKVEKIMWAVCLNR